MAKTGGRKGRPTMMSLNGLAVIVDVHFRRRTFAEVTDQEVFELIRKISGFELTGPELVYLRQIVTERLKTSPVHMVAAVFSHMQTCRNSLLALAADSNAPTPHKQLCAELANLLDVGQAAMEPGFTAASAR